MHINLKSTLIKFAKTTGIFSAFIGGLFLFDNYKANEMQKFCNEIPPNASPEDVLKLAKTERFPAFNVIETRGVISIFNQRSPYFRHECEIEYTNGKQAQKKVKRAG